MSDIKGLFLIYMNRDHTSAGNNGILNFQVLTYLLLFPEYIFYFYNF